METGQCMVEEYDRVGLKLTSHMVKPILSGPVQNLRLDTLNKVNKYIYDATFQYLSKRLKRL